MNETEIEQRKAELEELLRARYPDINVNIDIVNLNRVISIACFWNRISIVNYSDSKFFRCDINGYQNTLETEIIPYFNQLSF